MVGRDENHSYKPKLSPEGIHVNGWSIPWSVAILVLALAGHASVIQYRIGQVEERVDSTATKARKVDVIDNRISNNSETIRWHRIYEHSTHGTAPNTADIEEPRP